MGSEREPIKMPVPKKESAQARLLANTSDKVKTKIIQELKGEGFSRHKVTVCK